MKITKLSLVAVLAISSVFAGGDIAPVEPVVEAPVVEAAACNANTTINGKAQAYYYSDDSVDLFDQDSSQLATAVTLDVKHNFTDNIAANFTAVGYANTMSAGTFGYFEGQDAGAFINVANLTATYAGTTLVAGRQLLDTPMLGGFDWLLAPGAFEAYTLVNNSISNVTFVASYVAKWRMNNTGDNWADLTDAGDNWTVSAAYNGAFDASVWYYNVDAANYTQVYADAGMTFSDVKVAAQFVNTNYDVRADSTAFGIKAEATLGKFGLFAAYNNNQDSVVGYVGRDSLYTSSWNNFASNDIGDSYKVAATTTFAGLNAELSYADYETGGEELDLIAGYGVTHCFSVDAIYSSTKYTESEDALNALELIATYKF